MATDFAKGIKNKNDAETILDNILQPKSQSKCAMTWNRHGASSRFLGDRIFLNSQYIDLRNGNSVLGFNILPDFFVLVLCLAFASVLCRMHTSVGVYVGWCNSGRGEGRGALRSAAACAGAPHGTPGPLVPAACCAGLLQGNVTHRFEATTFQVVVGHDSVFKC